VPIVLINWLSFYDHFLLCWRMSAGVPGWPSSVRPGEPMTSERPDLPKVRNQGGSTRPTSARMLDAAERHRRALELKVLGWTHDLIAAELGYASRGAVTDAIKAAVRDAALPAAKEYRAILTERLEEMYRATRARAIREDGTVNDLDALDRCVRIVQRLESLYGLGGTKLKVGQDPEAGPVGIDATVQVAGTVEVLSQLSTEELRQFRDLRDRLASRIGPGTGGGSDGEAVAAVASDGGGPPAG